MKLFKQLSLFVAIGALMACSTQPEPVMLGGGKDKHGCLSSAGQSYSYLKQQCVQPFDIADIKLTDPANTTLAVYVILSDDKSQAEVFAADLPENTILDAVKGGYLSKDRKVRLTKTATAWKIHK
ncbi:MULTISPECIES: hypothetical protein [Glaesserella]|uniref:Lipoprotein n=1 Tax=Glaesserella australis TaxID=2094024 RepID=A0A328C5U8_9PAST|nr:MULTISPECIES: hypothetical protein [Glaesserella]AUI66822.1 hypothetical protein CJD39_09635 [Glaesserella sp. 15-184]RAL19874.1 hypothetical protein C5N92_00420 [Glaesserella australis]